MESRKENLGIRLIGKLKGFKDENEPEEDIGERKIRRKNIPT